MDIASLYADGGICGPNPSPRGGTWCWVGVDAKGFRIATDSDIVTPNDIGLPAVTNNVTELLACLEALDHVPDTWNGTLYTDSNVTRLRLRLNAKMKNVPPYMIEWLKDHKKRLGTIKAVLLGGHPTKQELIRGKRKDGLPCSTHQVFCDAMCTKLAHSTNFIILNI